MILDNGDGTFDVNGNTIIGSALSPEALSSIKAQAQAPTVGAPSSIALPTGPVGPMADVPMLTPQWQRGAASHYSPADYSGVTAMPDAKAAASTIPPKLDPGAIENLGATLSAAVPKATEDNAQSRQQNPNQLVTVGQQVQVGPKLKEGDWKALADAYKAKTSAETEMAKANSTAQTHLAEIEQKRADYEDKFIAAKQTRQAEQAAAVDLQLQNIKEAVVSHEKTNADPTKYLHDASAGEKIGRAIALAMGAFGASLTKGPNFVQQIFDQEANAEMAKMRAGLDKAKEGVELENNLMAQIMRKGATREEAETASRIYQLARFETQVKTAAARDGSQQALKVGDMMSARTQEEQAQLVAKLRLETGNKITLQQQSTGVGQGPGHFVDVNIRDKDGTTVGTKRLTAPSEKDAEELRDRVASTESLKDKILAYKNLLSSTTSTTFDRQANAKLESMKSDIVNDVVHARGNRNPTESDLRDAAKVVPDATSWFTRRETTNKLLDQLYNTAQAGVMQQFISRGMVAPPKPEPKKK